MIDRAYGAMIGGAIGDAMGMPASFFTREKISRVYGYISDFLEPNDVEQTSHGNLTAGSVTDDTQESMIVSNILMKHEKFQRDAFIEEMRRWAVNHNMLESTVIGPSTRKFLEAIVEGKDPTEASRLSTTNGSAMRVAPVGIKFYYNFDRCMEEAAASSFPSHSSKPCVAGACAIAVAVAAGVRGGFAPEEVLDLAYQGALYGEKVGWDITGPSVSKRILLAKEIVDQTRSQGIERILDELVGVIGAGMQAYESVPFSLGVFYAVSGDGQTGILAAVNGGDDADTNGAITGNLCGAYSGASALPEHWRNRVEAQSSIDFRDIAENLIKSNFTVLDSE